MDFQTLFTVAAAMAAISSMIGHKPLPHSLLQRTAPRWEFRSQQPISPLLHDCTQYATIDNIVTHITTQCLFFKQV